MRFIFGTIGIIVGVVIVWKTFELTNIFGKVDWAERVFGGGFGGTYFMYKLIGIVLIVLSAMYMFHILDIFILPLRNVFGGLTNQQQ